MVKDVIRKLQGDVIMVGHISCPNVTGNNIPASLSGQMINEILRGDLGFEGIVITDGMNMGAISESYTADQAAIEAVLAGVDLILMPEDFQSAYYGVLQAVQNGSIPEDRINESLRRILELKLRKM